MAASSGERTALLWFRRDLRLADHPALSAVLSEFDRIVPLFVWDPLLIRTSGAKRLAFVAACVGSLRDSLDGALVIRTGDPELVVRDAAGEAGALAVFLTADYGPYGSDRDRRTAAAICPVEMVPVGSPYAVAPGTLITSGGSPFQVFSAYARAWRAHGWPAPAPPPALSKITRAGLTDSYPPQPLPAAGAPVAPAGEEAAHGRLDEFLEAAVRRYRHDRDRPDLDPTSCLSPYLKTGCLHPRQVLSRLEPGDPGSDTFRDELCWREFFADILFHRPDTARHPYRRDWKHFPVDTGPEADRRFEAWTRGQTGYPIVDAGMRQLFVEGWMPNRVRMITASFLVKDLHVDWRRGARWFMQRLVDGDLASNQLNWQWVAGCGTDAAPFFRVFNPASQSKKFDPEGRYVRRWVPELEGTGPDEIHDPWRRGERSPYPRPLVDHQQERRIALDRFNHLRNRDPDPTGGQT